MRARNVAITSVGTGAGLAAAIYGSLIPKRRFAAFVGTRLGIGPELADAMLELARERFGDPEYDVRAALFAIAFRAPSRLFVTSDIKIRAARALIFPMFAAESAPLAYALDDARVLVVPCDGLVSTA